MSNKPLVLLAAAPAFFRLGNGAMLPLYGLAAVGEGKGNPAMFTATTIVVAQAVMIVASLVALRVAAKRGCWLIILNPFAALPLRGLLTGFCRGLPRVAGPGAGRIGAGLESVAVPGLIVCILGGSGRAPCDRCARERARMPMPLDIRRP